MSRATRRPSTRACEFVHLRYSPSLRVASATSCENLHIRGHLHIRFQALNRSTTPKLKQPTKTRIPPPTTSHSPHKTLTLIIPTAKTLTAQPTKRKPTKRTCDTTQLLCHRSLGNPPQKPSDLLNSCRYGWLWH
jgi:hypothetical protein